MPPAGRSGIPCAAHSPPRKRGEIDRGWLHERGSKKKIMLKSLKKRLKIDAHALLEGTEGREFAQGRLGWTTRVPRSAQERPKSAQERPKSGPRAPQERPKSAQESPKSGQERPKTSPRDVQEAPRRVQSVAQEASKRDIEKT